MDDKWASSNLVEDQHGGLIVARRFAAHDESNISLHRACDLLFSLVLRDYEYGEKLTWISGGRVESGIFSSRTTLNDPLLMLSSPFSSSSVSSSSS